MTYTAMPIEELDALPAAGFVEAVAPLFEGAPGFLARLAGDRPYGSWWNLLSRARTVAQAMPEADQLELLNAHPRLGAPPESVSSMSFGEQGYDRPSSTPLADRVQRSPAPAPPGERPTWGSAASAGAARPAGLTPTAPTAPAGPRAGGTDDGDSTRAKLARLNAAYEDWFGFRYCVFVAGRPLEALVPELELAMAQSREHELRRGIDAVIDIAIARSGTAR
ncbi:MAG TPA: 2-oxo-4-hydroxy-4-carboxy-5-ureidoimidazoline decarboxylase [Candidatus Limnocylindrales bacterium]|nr:2-oxo-4-hydroxy-4-carboxy-5-ureidoimidazoline decarboxylase [Candidatus Limnocylindrales bacterium]